MEGSNFPLIKDVDHVLAGHCEKRRGGDMFIQPPGYVLAVTNPADSGNIPPDNTVSAQGTTPQPVAETTTVVFVDGVQLIPGPPGPTGPRGIQGPTQMPAPVNLVISNSAVTVDATTPLGTVTLAPIYYRLLLTEANVLIRTPTGTLLDSQRLIIEIIQDSVGGRTVTWDSGYNFGIDIASAVPTTTPNKRDFVAWLFSNGRWDCVGFTNGY